jgi:hypothetical protein
MKSDSVDISGILMNTHDINATRFGLAGWQSALNGLEYILQLWKTQSLVITMVLVKCMTASLIMNFSPLFIASSKVSELKNEFSFCPKKSMLVSIWTQKYCTVFPLRLIVWLKQLEFKAIYFSRDVAIGKVKHPGYRYHSFNVDIRPYYRMLTGVIYNVLNLIGAVLDSSIFHRPNIQNVN